MPKLLPELRGRILACARQHVIFDEAHDFSTRQIAVECGIAAGTVYNHFSTKEEILANIMLEDWTACLDGMNAEASGVKTIEQGLLMMESKLRAFSKPFLSVWSNYSRAPLPSYHSLLIKQISASLETVLDSLNKSCGETEKLLISEILLSCSQRESGLIEKLIPVIERLLD